MEELSVVVLEKLKSALAEIAPSFTVALTSVECLNERLVEVVVPVLLPLA